MGLHITVLIILNVIRITYPSDESENVTVISPTSTKLSKETLLKSFEGMSGLANLLKYVQSNAITTTMRIDVTPNLTVIASGRTNVSSFGRTGFSGTVAVTSTNRNDVSTSNTTVQDTCETTQLPPEEVDIIETYNCPNLTDSEEEEFRCFIGELRMGRLQGANCTIPQQDITAQVIRGYRCQNDTDIINKLKLYYDLIDVFKKTRQPTSSTTTAVLTTTLPPRSESYSLNEAVDPQKKLVQWTKMIRKMVSYRNNGSSMNLTTVNSVTQQLQTIVNDQNQTNDISKITHIMSHIAEVEVTDSNTVEMFTSITTTLIQSYEEIPQTEEGQVMPSLLNSMEKVLSLSIPFENLNISTSEMDVTVAEIKTNLSNGDVMTLSSYTSTVIVPVTVFDGRQSRVSMIVYKTINKKWSVKKGYKRAKIGSEVMSVSIQCTQDNVTEDVSINMTGSIIVVLATTVTKREKKRLCTFWNFEESFWDTDGATVMEKNTTHTKCKFDHLTNFAVLVLYYDDKPINKRQRQVLNILTTCGCSFSIVCLCVTVIVYIYLRVLNNHTVMIHANLSLALLLAQLVLVTSNDAVENMAACKAVAAMLHFFFMSSFAWMMVEGIALYLSCTRPIHTSADMHVKYFLIGWGMPAVIVLVSLGAQFPNYGNGEENSCWLSLEDGLIWAFMGPMVAIVLFNVAILVLVIKVFLTLKTNSRKSEAAKLRASVRAMVTLLPILGITWLLGILVPFSDVFHYLFVIGNSMQGMLIFFLHCICNNTVRRKFLEIRRRSSTGFTGSFSDISDGHGEAPKDHQLAELRVPNRRWRDEHYAWM